MKKKIIYSMIIISIFLLSTIAIVAQPVAGATWKFGVPDQAKGIDLEKEVMVYDKDTWGDCKGYSIDDTANAIFGKGETGANDVGAKEKTVIKDWGYGDIWYFGDHILESDLSPSTQLEKGLYNRWQYFLYLDETAKKLGSAMYGLASLSEGYLVPDTHNQTIIAYIKGNSTTIMAGSYDRAAITALFSTTFKGTELERELWYYTKDYESKPNEKEDLVPYIKDPHNIMEAYKMFTGFFDAETGKFLNMYSSLLTWYFATQYMVGDAYTVLNTTAAGILTNLGKSGYIGKALFGYDNVVAVYKVIEGGLDSLVQALVDNRPDKKTYLTGLLRAGLPGYTPIDKWWEKILDDFNLDDDALWRTSVYDYHQGGIYLDGMTVVVEFEWYYVQDWHGDKYEDREDYEERYTYSDTGSQSLIEFTSGDDTFYKIESLSPAIPGYEITIFLASAAISALGLIYVMMKKRRK